MRVFAGERQAVGCSAEFARGRKGRRGQRALGSQAAKAVARGRLRGGVFVARVVCGLVVVEELCVGSRGSRGGLLARTARRGVRDGEGGVYCLEDGHVASWKGRYRPLASAVVEGKVVGGRGGPRDRRRARGLERGRQVECGVSLGLLSRRRFLTAV